MNSISQLFAFSLLLILRSLTKEKCFYPFSTITSFIPAKYLIFLSPVIDGATICAHSAYTSSNRFIRLPWNVDVLIVCFVVCYSVVEPVICMFFFSNLSKCTFILSWVFNYVSKNLPEDFICPLCFCFTIVCIDIKECLKLNNKENIPSNVAVKNLFCTEAKLYAKMTINKIKSSFNTMGALFVPLLMFSACTLCSFITGPLF